MAGSESGAAQDCACVTRAGAWRAVDERCIGIDRTNGRFADVTLRRCASCGRLLWLRYQLEYEAFSRSGRRAEGVIDAAAAAAITPESAGGSPRHAALAHLWRELVRPCRQARRRPRALGRRLRGSVVID